jgi:oligoendopeptidase F
VQTPGYVYAYAFGNLFALAVYGRYEQGGAEFVPRYLEMLSAGGSVPPEELGRIVGVDLADPGFWSGGLETIARAVDEAESLADSLGV